ncbi:MAG: PASTA domain-containing protein [Ruminococcaceae bacterium]|nr:PASTA domain-containing protein [Oscillospiraceae bacterium]
MDIYEKYVGQIFDNRYRIEKVIGIGGMAIVFKATDLLMRRLVAVKILKDEIASDEQSVKRFINESKAVAMLSHPNIVNIYDVSVRDNIKYIVMEYVDGITLKNYMRHREVLNLREIISYTTQILKALMHAHKKGIIHRDIKPQNIMLLKNGVIKVMDFGIAKLPNAETVTMTDKAIGTVYYISPEQVNGTQIDARSDLYALGVMMYEMATGQLPFTAETPVSVALMQVNDVAVPPREINPQIPVGLEQIIRRAMEKEKETRYQSAEDMLAHLMRLKENPRVVFRENARVTKRSEGKRVKKGSRSMFPIIMGVTLAFLIVAAVSGYYIIDKLFINSAANNYQTISVQDFVGTEYSDRLKEWFDESVQYTLANVIYEYNDHFAEGVIISQTPKADESKKILAGKQKCTITLVVSKGTETLVLEDYTVKDYREAEAELRSLGMAVQLDETADEYLNLGYVVSMSPEPGTEVKIGDTVTLYVNYGKDTMKVLVPNFSGLTEAEVLIKLIENDLRPGKITYEKSNRTPGTVIEQSADSMKEIEKYAEIDFVISGGAFYSGDGTTVPTYWDYTEKETEPPETEPPETEPEETEDPDDGEFWVGDDGEEDTNDSWDFPFETDGDGGFTFPWDAVH